MCVGRRGAGGRVRERGAGGERAEEGGWEGEGRDGGGNLGLGGPVMPEGHLVYRPYPLPDTPPEGPHTLQPPLSHPRETQSKFAQTPEGGDRGEDGEDGGDERDLPLILRLFQGVGV